MSIPASEIEIGDLVWVKGERIRGKVVDIMDSGPWPFVVMFHDREEPCYYPASEIMLVEKEQSSE